MAPNADSSTPHGPRTLGQRLINGPVHFTIERRMGWAADGKVRLSRQAGRGYIAPTESDQTLNLYIYKGRKEPHHWTISATSANEIFEVGSPLRLRTLTEHVLPISFYISSINSTTLEAGPDDIGNDVGRD